MCEHIRECARAQAAAHVRHVPALASALICLIRNTRLAKRNTIAKLRKNSASEMKPFSTYLAGSKTSGVPPALMVTHGDVESNPVAPCRHAPVYRLPVIQKPCMTEIHIQFGRAHYAQVPAAGSGLAVEPGHVRKSCSDQAPHSLIVPIGAE